MTIEETEAIVVRRIFNLYLQGLGTQAIANILNDEVVPRRYGHSKWHSATIKYIITNERYMGDVLLQKKFTKGVPDFDAGDISIVDKVVCQVSADAKHLLKLSHGYDVRIVRKHHLVEFS